MLFARIGKHFKQSTADIVQMKKLLTRLASASFMREFSPLISSLPSVQSRNATGRLKSGHANLWKRLHCHFAN